MLLERGAASSWFQFSCSDRSKPAGRGVILHAFFQGTNPFAQTFAELRQFLWTEHQQGNKEDDQQVHRLK